MGINTLLIRGLKLSCLIGAYAHERLAPQTLSLNLKLICEDLSARQTDQLEDTIDYDRLAQHLTHLAESSKYFLIEKLGQVLLEACLNFDSRIKRAEVELEKFGCIQNAKSAVVTLS